jgi:hypothetical protein
MKQVSILVFCLNEELFSDQDFHNSMALFQQLKQNR